MDDLLSEFITETTESLTQIDLQLVEFEKDPSNAEILGNIFRLVHTVKGTCGFLGLPRLESVAHAGENVLDKYRDRALEVTPEGVTLVLKCIDTIRGLVDDLAENGSEPEGDDKELIAQLNALASGNAAPAPKAAPKAAAPKASGPVTDSNGFPVAAELLAEYEQATGSGSGSGGGGPVTDANGFPVAAELLAEYEQATGGGGASDMDDAAAEAAAAAEMEKMLAEMEADDEDAAPQAQVPAKAAAKAPAAKEAAKPAAKPAQGGGEGGNVQASLRVNVDVLENLMTMVSEMVLTRNQLLQMIRGHEDSEFTVPIQRLSHITTDLQEGVMKTRMQPIGNAWAKLPRIVRDLAIETGKKIDLQMLGAETELDRQVLDLIKDPLTHMVRNSADHGLERPADRQAAGKPETGTIVLNAYHEGGHIIIDIKDDGKGLNMDRIRQKCIENGLATESELDNMSDQQIQQFIFRAGFSTAEKVTSVSGRGVGMDVVRTNIEKIGGTIELKSVTGKGSTFTIKIPLTLAIVAALIVESCGEKFAIPQISVLELVRASSRSEYNIEVINESPVLRLRNRLLPLVHLGDLLKLSKGKRRNLDDETFIVVAQVGTYTFGIIVDRVFDTEEIVVKPVAPILRDISFYSGNTILGDGSVIMILDPNGIAAATGAVSSGADASETEHESAVTGEGGERVSMLIFRAGGDELKAVPLALVARLEEIEVNDVEVSHGEHMVQYRGQLMPLIPFNTSHQWKRDGRQAVLVFTENERSMGLVVDEIVDIVEDRLKVEITADAPGLIGSAVIDGHATDVIDAGYYLTKAFPDWFGGGRETAGLLPGKRALLVDDSPFFRNLLAPILSVAGYTVTTAESADDALKLREKGMHFDVIISDIEMPAMDGFAFAKEVRSDPRWGKVPMVALSARATDQDFERGRSVGFNDYVAKSDREELMRSLAHTVSSVTA